MQYWRRAQIYDGLELDYLLYELHIDSTPDSEVAEVLEAMTLSHVKLVRAMATKASFTHVRAFLDWKGTRNSDEVLFGSVPKVKKKGDAD